MENNNILNDLIGLTETEGRKLCKDNNYECRVIRTDSNYYPVTADLRLDRINLEFDKGIITKCYFG